MHITDLIITKKYAIAYLNAYQHELSNTIIEQIPIIVSYLKKHPSFLIFLDQPSLLNKEKEKVIDIFTQKILLGKSIRTLIDLLIKHKRLSFLVPVLLSIVHYYYKRNNIVTATIESSHKLDKQEKETLTSFATKITQAKVLKPQFIIKQSLISGIRIKSEAVLWEQSIDKILKNIQLSMQQRVKI